MSKPPKPATSRRKKAKNVRSLAELEAGLGDVERHILLVQRDRRALGEEPTADDIARRLGLNVEVVRPRLAALESLGLTARPPARVRGLR
jgi:predicted ArsR family transcriptional regulator